MNILFPSAGPESWQSLLADPCQFSPANGGSHTPGVTAPAVSLVSERVGGSRVCEKTALVSQRRQQVTGVRGRELIAVGP